MSKIESITNRNLIQQNLFWAKKFETEQEAIECKRKMNLGKASIEYVKKSSHPFWVCVKDNSYFTEPLIDE